ncbi:MAG TPA: carbamoyltransferase HypF [Methylomirabilota bacterium]
MASVSTPLDAARARRCTIAIEGVVQGVGFRPFVYRAAVRHGLAGSVRNSLQGALVEVEGDEQSLRRFLDEVTAPPAAISAGRRITLQWDEPRGGSDTFTIAGSAHDGEARLCPAPDLAVCDPCLGELSDPRDRRHGYALLACAECGPRFTMVAALPYDRERTTMGVFPLCARCRHEYEDPDDRRFHAEGIACPACGPTLTLHGADGNLVATTDPIARATLTLLDGGIVAVKGIGGYHLACDATAGASVAELRRRKHREAKPLAVMVKDLAEACALGHLSEVEAGLLASSARPIVLARRRAAAPIADEVAPGCRDIGIVLPYTPLHHLLLQAVGRPLVMTSGNASDETIAYRDDDARRRLRGVADLLVAHDRPIQVPCDDSVARVVRGTPQLVRRSRGYVPLAIRLPLAASRPVLACGGELKHTFALVRGDQAFLGQHLGDLATESAFRAFLDAVAHWRRLLELAPDVVAHDLHPGYRSSIYARSLQGVERIGVQHHHAHVASCLADNGVDRRVIGVAWDGTGHGADGQVWGGEFLVADLAGFERAGHFEPVPLPGGDAAIREPWRMAAVFLRAAYGEAMTGLDLAFVRRLDRAAWRVLARAADQGLNAPLTSSAGRLFDAVASLLGLRDRAGFEAQAAMELEALAEPEADRIYAARLDDVEGALVVRTTDVVRGVVEDLLAEVPPSRIAARFHATLADVLARVCERIRAGTGLGAVALSGGVFQNAWLQAAAIGRLERSGFEVYTHGQVPANDGGLALGQAAVAARRLAGRDHA